MILFSLFCFRWRIWVEPQKFIHRICNNKCAAATYYFGECGLWILDNFGFWFPLFQGRSVDLFSFMGVQTSFVAACFFSCHRLRLRSNCFAWFLAVFSLSLMRFGTCIGQGGVAVGALGFGTVVVHPFLEKKSKMRHGVDSGLAHLGSRWFRAGSSFANLARRFREAFAFFLVRFGEFCYLNLLLWSVCKISYCCLFLFVRIYDMLGCSLSWWYISLGILHAEPLLLQLSAHHALHGNHSLRLF